jgi:hypothetical protein
VIWALGEVSYVGAPLAAPLGQGKHCPYKMSFLVIRLVSGCATVFMKWCT